MSDKEINKEPQEEKKDGVCTAKIFAILSTVTGIISIFLFPFFAGALGIIFGIIAKKLGYKKGMSTDGIVCGIVGIVLHIIKICVVPCDILSLLVY